MLQQLTFSRFGPTDHMLFVDWDNQNGWHAPKIKKRMPWASQPLQQNLWSSWLLVNYFGVIQGVCDEDPKKI